MPCSIGRGSYEEAKIKEESAKSIAFSRLWKHHNEMETELEALRGWAKWVINELKIEDKYTDIIPLETPCIGVYELFLPRRMGE